MKWNRKYHPNEKSGHEVRGEWGGSEGKVQERNEIKWKKKGAGNDRNTCILIYAFVVKQDNGGRRGGSWRYVAKRGSALSCMYDSERQTVI